MRILILKPSSLGDVVHALPVLRLLKRALPQSEIYWWLEVGLISLLEHDPDLAGIIPFERRRWKSPRHWDEVWRSVQRIRRLSFDWVIDLQSLLRSGVVSWLANGGFTIGLDDPREGAALFYDVAIPRPSRATHAVDWYLRVLPALGIPISQDFVWFPPDPAAAAAVEKKWRPEGRQWIALQPGARWLNKRWPIESFAALVRETTAAYPEVHFVIFGGASDQPLGEALAQASPSRCLNLAGATTLRETIEWLRRSALLVTNDTGPMHMAAALGTPTVALFGPTDPRRTGPYGQSSQVLRHPLPCAPCLKDRCAWAQPMECLRAIAPARVLVELERRLSEAKPARRG